MNLEKDVLEVEAILNKYVNNPEFKKLKAFVAHGHTSLYNHCIRVALTAYLINRKLNLNCNEEDIIVGGLLHDFYSYDWHNVNRLVKYSDMHGVTHPIEAMNRAKENFDINDNVAMIIRTHMWPLAITHYPKSKEAWVVNLADKICSFKETLHIKG